jgi:hypothetical protein
MEVVYSFRAHTVVVIADYRQNSASGVRERTHAGGRRGTHMDTVTVHQHTAASQWDGEQITGVRQYVPRVTGNNREGR